MAKSFEQCGQDYMKAAQEFQAEAAEELAEEGEEYNPEEEAKILASYAPTVSEESSAKASLLALVQEADNRFHTGKTAAEMQQMVKNLYFNCCAKYASDVVYNANRASLIHGSVAEAVQEMCLVGMEKMEKFNPERGNFSTFLNYAFNNYSNTLFNHRRRDARFWADSANTPLSGEDDSFTLEDTICCKDDPAEALNVYNAKCFVLHFIMEHAAKNLSAEESKVFFLRHKADMSNGEIAAMLACKKKSVENAYSRALSHLRKEAVDELYHQLWKKFGYHTMEELWQAEAQLDDDGVYCRGSIA